jgi:hypothetical protein
MAMVASLFCGIALTSAPAYGSTVTVGPQLPLPNPFGTPIGCEAACTLANAQMPGGASYQAPISGVIVRWRLFGADHLNAGYRIRVIKHLGEGSAPYAGLRSGPVQYPTSRFETLPVNVPIQAGQMVALNLESQNAVLGFEFNSGAPALLWEPPLEVKKLRSAAEGEGLIFGFNADIQPPPAIAYLASVKGPIKGGTEVTLTGTDFTGATAVSFGAVPAASFVVDSDEQITAVSPPSATPGFVAVSVTTPAGVATSQFRYLACVVPKLKKRSLRAAKALLRNARCHIGRVTRLADVKARTGEVSSQKPNPGSVLTPGSRVRVTLRPRS